MKFIPANEVKLQHSLRVTSDASHRQILRFALDQYVVINMEDAKMITAFESKKFSDLLNTLKQSIVDIEVIATRPILSSKQVAPNATGFEIRLKLQDGQGRIFNSVEEAFAYEIPGTKSLIDEDRHPATNVWSLPGRHPIDRLLVTPQFIRWIDQFSATSCASHILERCFMDFRSQQDPGKVWPGKPIPVEGEFGSFEAAEYLCGRICFHRPE